MTKLFTSASAGYSLLRSLPASDLIDSNKGDQNGSFLLSFQNSGNHLVRAFLECMWRRPTIGCPKNKFNDSLIFASNSAGFTYDNINPIACKGHTVSDLYHHYSSSSLCGPGLIFITRNPVDVMVSYSRHVRNPLKSFLKNDGSFVGSMKTVYKLLQSAMSDKPIRNFIDLHFLNYLQLVDFFLGYEGPKIHLMFEQLVDSEMRINAFQRLVDWHNFEISIPPVDATVSEIIEYVDEMGKIALSRKGLGPCSNNKSKCLVEKLIKSSKAYNSGSFDDSLSFIDHCYPKA